MNANRIKALIYRELAIKKKQNLMAVAALVFILVFVWMILLSMKIGNLASVIENPDLSADDFIDTKKIFSFFAQYIPVYCIVLLASDNSMFILDIKSKWRIFSFTLPCSPLECTTARYIMKMVIIIVGYILCLINTFLVTRFQGNDFSIDIAANLLLCFDIGLLFDIPNTVVGIGARTEKEVYAGPLIFMGGMFAVLICFVAKLKNIIIAAANSAAAAENLNEDETSMLMLNYAIDYVTDIIKTLRYFAIPAFFLLIVLGFFLCMKASERREK